MGYLRDTLTRVRRGRDLIFRMVYKFFEQKEFLRIIIWVLIIWLIGASLLYFLERDTNSDFNSLPKAFWNIAVYLFSGLDSGHPTTVGGQIVATVVLILSAGVVAVFTAQIASFFIERKLRGRMNLPKYKLKDHIVICNWNELAIPLIEQIHADVVDYKRPVVIISQDDNAGNFPNQYSGVYEDVFIIKGDPTKEEILKRAGTLSAHSVIVLADRTLGDLGDAKSILICLAVRSLESKSEDEDIHIHICVEGADLRHVEHLEKADANEIICSEDFGMGLLAQSALSHNLSKIYRRLVTNSKSTNEFYQIEIPKKFLKYTFTELGKYIYENRDSENPFLLVGINRDGDPIVNPKPHEIIRIEEGDLGIVIAWKKPELV